MRRLLALVAVISLSIPGIGAADVPPASAATMPDALVKSWTQALRRNDLTGGFALLPEADRGALELQWQRQMARPDQLFDVQFDTLLRLARNQTANDQLLAMAQPYLAQIDMPTMTRAITEIAGLLSMAADTRQAGATGGLDYVGLRDWLKDLAAWLPSAGLTDQAKAKLAAGHLVAALKASTLGSAAELRALPLPLLLAKLGPALPALKEALAVYDVPVDPFLDGFTGKLVDANADNATIALGFQSLGKARTITLKLVRKNNGWDLAPGNDNPLVGLSQLVMMTMLMQGMGTGAPAQPPATPPPAKPIDDGAL